MLKRKNIVFVVICFLCVFGMYPNVQAATAKYTGSSGIKIYYSGGNYSFYNKKLDNNIAYCMQLGKSIAAVGAEYTSSGWNNYTYDAFIAGQIIKYGKELYSGQNEYLYIQYGLNCYFKWNGYFGCGDVANKLINKAKKRVANYNYVNGSNVSSLPSLSVSFENGRNSLVNSGGAQNYVSDKINVAGLVASEYGGNNKDSGYTSTKPQYTVTATANNGGTAYLCNEPYYNANCAQTVTFDSLANYSTYVVLLNGGLEGGSVTVTISGSNRSDYPSATRWAPKKGNHQKLSTYVPSVPVTRSVSIPIVLTYTKTGSYSVSLRKVDENGQNLTGASLTLYTSSDIDGKNDKKTLCSISSTTNPAVCTKSDLNDGNAAEFGYSSGRFLCYSEGTEPNGYKKITTKCDEISLQTSKKNFYMEVTDDNGKINYKSLDPTDYYKYKNAKNYCITNTEDNFDATYVNGVLSVGVKEGGNLKEGSCDVSPSGDDTLSAADDSTGGDSTGGDSTGGDSTGGSGEGGGTSTTTYGKTICVTYVDNSNTLIYDEDGTYCKNHGALSSFEQTDGNVNLSITNALNVVNISKKAITGTDEIPGAKLSIYTTDKDGNCTKTLAKAKKFEYKPFKFKNTGADDSESDATNTENTNQGSSESGNSTDSGTSSDSSSSTDSGASSIDKDETKVNVIDALTWESSYAPAIISGLNPGTYCLVEEIAPNGYKRVTSSVKFSMDSEGKVKLVDDGKGSAKIEEEKSETKSVDSTITLLDDIIDITVSKTDAATTKELPGANLSICEASKDESGKYEMMVSNAGDCTVVSLADGSLATWTSTDKPHVVHGLGSGAYYLVETIAPKGYSTAESILFIVNEDGSLTDKDGKSLKDSKLVMRDSLIKDSKTGSLGTYIVAMILVLATIGGFGSYYLLKKQENKIV